MIIRTLAPSDLDALRNFYLALCPDDRRKRFCCSLSDDSVSRYVDSLNFLQHLVLGAFDDQSRLVGVAELAPGDKAREMAFSVRPDMRSRSIGTTLMERLLFHASLLGVKRVFVMFLSDNTPMRRMARRAGMRVETDGGESYAARELPAPDAGGPGRPPCCVATPESARGI